MTDTGSRTITFYESVSDVIALASRLDKYKPYSLAVAIRVLKNGKAAEANMVWRSHPPTPIIHVSWKTQYALGWASKVSGGDAIGILHGDASVTPLGKWQPCLVGKSYDINRDGLWEPSADTSKADPACLNVGKISYANPDASLGVHIVVGILNDSGTYEPIFADLSPMQISGNAKYQPEKSVKFWYHAILNSNGSREFVRQQVGELNTVNPGSSSGKYEWWGTFLMNENRWDLGDQPPPGPSERESRSRNP
ncbi:unnamed protein product [Tilletia controversa]|uniref:Uncharacterized protein n=2 Tax=Tilletia TaxID=13289 RepID=A0A177VBZ6_9BASI|nr:hypothetical protein CF336_g7716 [Tilletia laevis]KAE8187699.1 hypothetical protein CF328_g6834 [Tilletia controversa]KAE8247338.1 hypothetical protein A4X03_0g7071 [Tilletia caries]KAE8187374.1 hypothetical protein CF335_g7194 [Tilletia laevis]CAD6892400.1 unnamed protein product [Tilletia caries]